MRIALYASVSTYDQSHFGKLTRTEAERSQPVFPARDWPGLEVFS